jgi:hypothetical protein
MWRGVKGLAVIAGLALGLGMGLGTSLQAQAVKRLILTDGSYQSATEWKKEGDRVKYFSAERSEWEELPVALVDWKATDEWNAAASKSTDEELKQLSGEEVAARKAEQTNTPLVAPKVAPELRLPAEGGVFLLEEQAGKAMLLTVPGSKPQENDHDGQNLLKRSLIPITSRLQTIELKGAAAKVRVHSATPLIFLDVENGQGEIAGDYFRIVRLERKKELRVVATSKTGMSGEARVKEAFLHSRVEKFSGDWWKLIPLEDLTPGEYAIVTDGVCDNASGVVWDFGVER